MYQQEATFTLRTPCINSLLQYYFWSLETLNLLLYESKGKGVFEEVAQAARDSSSFCSMKKQGVILPPPIPAGRDASPPQRYAPLPAFFWNYPFIHLGGGGRQGHVLNPDLPIWSTMTQKPCLHASYMKAQWLRQPKFYLDGFESLFIRGFLLVLHDFNFFA